VSEDLRDFLRYVFSLPVERQRELLLEPFRVGYFAYGRDWELNTATFADDYEFHNGGTRPLVGFESAYGREGYIATHTLLLETLNIERIELDDLRPLGDGKVVVFTRIVIGAGGRTIDQLALDYHEFRDGQLARQVVWFDRDEGLRELGLD
jgi:hypothetical protein